MTSTIQHACVRLRSSAAVAIWLQLVAVLDARVIDDFQVGDYSLIGANATVNQTQSGLDPSHVVGGSRFVSFRSFAMPPSTLTIAGPTGTLDVSPGGCCTYLTVRYGDTANPLQLNLLDDGSDRFQFDFAELTSEISYSLPSVFARDGAGHEARVLTSSTLTVQPTAPFSLTVPFSGFPNFDWTDVASIEITVSRYGGGTGRAGQSFSLDRILTVPEPAGGLAGFLSVSLVAAIYPRATRRNPAAD